MIQYKNLIKTKIINRPSKINKSPYLVDILINNKIVMAHSPALGMSGLITVGTIVYVEKNTNEKNISKYKIKFIENNLEKKIYIGGNPVEANQILKQTFITKKLIKNKILKNISTNINNWKSEVSIKDCNKCSRIDFQIDNYFIEVKNVPLASYYIDNINNKILDFYKNTHKLFINFDRNKKYAVFPDGYTKTKNDLVSERAYKHLITLEKLSKNYIPLLIFVVLRSDCDYFIPNFIRDYKYSNKLKNLIESKKIYCYCFSYKIIKTKNNFKYKFNKLLPIILDFNNDKFKYLSINKIKKIIN